MEVCETKNQEKKITLIIIIIIIIIKTYQKKITRQSKRWIRSLSGRREERRENALSFPEPKVNKTEKV